MGPSSPHSATLPCTLRTAQLPLHLLRLQHNPLNCCPTVTKAVCFLALLLAPLLCCKWRLHFVMRFLSAWLRTFTSASSACKLQCIAAMAAPGRPQLPGHSPAPVTVTAALPCSKPASHAQTGRMRRDEGSALYIASGVGCMSSCGRGQSGGGASRRPSWRQAVWQSVNMTADCLQLPSAALAAKAAYQAGYLTHAQGRSCLSTTPISLLLLWGCGDAVCCKCRRQGCRPPPNRFFSCLQ